MNKTKEEIEKYILEKHLCVICGLFSAGLSREFEIGLGNANKYITNYNGPICPSIDYFLYGNFYHDSSIDNLYLYDTVKKKQ